MRNALNWFEIPVADLARAKRFYETILQTSLEESSMEDTTMAMLPHDPDGVGGSLSAGPRYTPGGGGTLVYLNGGDDLAPIIGRVADAGGKVLLPKTLIDEEIGYMALFEDTEGNQVGLHSPH